MDAATLSELVSLPNGIFVILLLFGAYVMKQLRADAMKSRDEAIKREEKIDAIRVEEKMESIKREERLMTHIDRYDESLNEMNSSIQGINASLSNLTNKVDDLEQKIR